jgi:hypothetical protein
LLRHDGVGKRHKQGAGKRQQQGAGEKAGSSGLGHGHEICTLACCGKPIDGILACARPIVKRQSIAAAAGAGPGVRITFPAG